MGAHLHLKDLSSLLLSWGEDTSPLGRPPSLTHRADSGPLILFGSVPPCLSDPHQLLCPQTSFHSHSLQLCP